MIDTAPVADRVLTKGYEIVGLLSQMELTLDGLIEAVQFAESERALCTSNDALGFDAITVYDKAARRLREIFCGPRWEKDNGDNQAAIKNPFTKARVVPCNFDENAGNRLVQPTNRTPKGEVSRAKSRCNATAWLTGLPDVHAQKGADFVTWILGIYAVDGEPLRAELSFPVDFSAKQFTRFQTRIILLTGDEVDFDTGRKTSGGDTVQVADIVVTRK